MERMALKPGSVTRRLLSSLNSVNPAIVDQTALDMSTDVDGIGQGVPKYYYHLHLYSFSQRHLVYSILSVEKYGLTKVICGKNNPFLTYFNH